jgi:thiamine-monophosphate kinase
MVSSEIALIQKLAKGLPRSRLQLNALCESDAELIRLPGSETVLALTTDGIVEEIAAGLYTDPYLIGWMAVTVNASDLAAVGADPIGVLLSETLRPDLDDAFLRRLQRGIHDACEACGLFVFGGDTNFAPTLQIAATALGTFSNGAPLTRLGCTAGEHLYASARLGLGGAFALSRLDPSAPPVRYLPIARIREGQLLRRFASCCMDTSDGVIPTLDELMRLNRVGFHVDADLHDILHPDALGAAREAGLPEWLTLAGPHGEFELLFTLPDAARDDFDCAAGAAGWIPIRLGAVTPEPGLRLGALDLDATHVRDLFAEVGGDARRFIAELVRYAAELASIS